MTSCDYARYLPAALEAILEQSRPAEEVLVIDDASQDESPRILEAYAARHPNLRLRLHSRRKGVIERLNQSLGETSQPMVLFAGADDLLAPRALQLWTKGLAMAPEAAFCAGVSEPMDEEGRPLIRRRFPSHRHQGWVPPSRALRIMRGHGFWFSGAATVFRRKRLLDAGGFDPELGLLCDSFVAQVLALQHGFCYLPQPLVWQRYSPLSYSQQLLGHREGMAQFRSVMRVRMQERYPELFPPRFVKQWDGLSNLLTELYACKQEISAKRKSSGRWQASLAAINGLARLMPMVMGQTNNPLLLPYLSLTRLRHWIAK